jgi:predicted RNase H-like HicB family nuclease
VAEAVQSQGEGELRTCTVIVQWDPDTGVLVGSIPGRPGAHRQATTLDELETNPREGIAMLLENGDPTLESEFVAL